MSLGNVSEWNKLWDLFLNEHEPQEKYKLMLALTASKESWLLTRYVFFIFIIIKVQLLIIYINL